MSKLSVVLGSDACVVVHPGLGTPAAVGQQAAALSAPDAAYGRELFQAKGCVTCHLHKDVARSGSFSIGPNLTNYRPNPEFVRQWLSVP